MADIIQFPRVVPGSDSALVCTCGCMTWLLKCSGEVQCAGCDWVLPAVWAFDDVLDAEEEEL